MNYQANWHAWRTFGELALDGVGAIVAEHDGAPGEARRVLRARAQRRQRLLEEIHLKHVSDERIMLGWGNANSKKLCRAAENVRGGWNHFAR